MSLAPILARLDPHSSLSLRMLASKLTAENLPTPAGGAEWTAATVARVKAGLAGSGDRHPPEAADPLARSNYSKRDRTFAYKGFPRLHSGPQRPRRTPHQLTSARILARRSCSGSLGRRENPRDHFALPVRVDRPVRGQCRRYVFVTQILAPGFDLSGRPTDCVHSRCPSVCLKEWGGK